jgi:peptidoglycan hydrolase CwlO-like protein
MSSRSPHTFLSIAIILAITLGSLSIPWAYPNVFAQTVDTAARQQQLQAQLDAIEAQIAEQQQVLSQTKTQGASISRDISILDAQINEAKLQIQAHNIAIQQLGQDIGTKQQTITTLSSQIEQEKESLAAIMRQTDALDHYSLADVMLSQANFSDFFVDLGSYSALTQSLQTLFGQIQVAKAQTQTEEQTLKEKQNNEIAIKINVQTEEANIQKNEAQKQKLLSLNKQQQKNYQSIIADSQKQAQAIEDALFALRDSSAIKFSTALQYANAASVKTGVRPAFLLAILTQETNLGANIGSCYVTSPNGDGIKIKTGAIVSAVMKGSRDVPPFLALMQQLGRDPYHTPVSCPQGSGYGGGMGPSQFIPSTWALMVPEISAATGKSVPDPFNASDAFMASAIYLGNLGASGGSTSDERNAACKYYSGRACTSTSFNGFYGDSVVKIAATIQNNINILQNTGG